MIKLFRNIRQKMLTENSPGHSGSVRASRLGKYLIYALGEVVLVMIGILLALQANNWNENRKLQNEEVKLLKEIKLALIKDHDDIISNIAEHESAASSCLIISKSIAENLPYHDSLNFHFSNALNTTRFNHTSSAYETLKIKGTDLIKNDTIRIKLIEYYDNHVDYQFDLQRLSLQSFDQAKERQFELFKNVCVCKKGMEPIDYEALKKNAYYRSWVEYTYGERKWETLEFKDLKGFNEELVALIDNETIVH